MLRIFQIPLVYPVITLCDWRGSYYICFPFFTLSVLGYRGGKNILLDQYSSCHVYVYVASLVCSGFGGCF